MEDGDLGTWNERRLIVVLEGCLAKIPEVTSTSKRFGRKTHVESPPVETWGWSKMVIKQINQKAQQFSQPIDIVTFTSQEVADMAADWLYKYNVQVVEVEFMDFDMFCESLAWSRNIERIIDSEEERINRYGQLGYQAQFGGYF